MKNFEDLNAYILSSYITSTNKLDKELFDKYAVKRGLRDIDGRGVLVGLTNVGDVHSYIIDESELVPVAGRLTYRGINIEDLTKHAVAEGRMGFEETSFLLLFGHLPTSEELNYYQALIGKNTSLDHKFIKSYLDSVVW